MDSRTKRRPRDPDGAWEVGAFAKNVFDTQRAILADPTPRTTPYRTFTAAFNGATTYRVVTYNAPQEFCVTARIAIGSR